MAMEPLVAVRTTADVNVIIDSHGLQVLDGPMKTEINARGATPDEAFAKLARFASSLVEAVADAAEQYGIE